VPDPSLADRSCGDVALPAHIAMTNGTRAKRMLRRAVVALISALLSGARPGSRFREGSVGTAFDRVSTVVRCEAAGACRAAHAAVLGGASSGARPRRAARGFARVDAATRTPRFAVVARGATRAGASAGRRGLAGVIATPATCQREKSGENQRETRTHAR
jgi:hypothetical protein